MGDERNAGPEAVLGVLRMEPRMPVGIRDVGGCVSPSHVMRVHWGAEVPG